MKDEIIVKYVHFSARKNRDTLNIQTSDKRFKELGYKTGDLIKIIICKP